MGSKLLPLRKVPPYPVIDTPLNGRKVRFPTNPGKEYVIIRVFGNKTERGKTPETTDFDSPRNRKNDPSITCTIARLENGELGLMEYAYVKLRFIEQPDGKTEVEKILEIYPDAMSPVTP